jgi:hypothetical protein
LSLLRDALARVLPVEIQYEESEQPGNLIDNVVILPRPSIDGRTGSRWLEGVIIGLGVTELGPLTGSSPYRDAPDLASVSILQEDGSIEGLLLDLQRPDPLTAQDEWKILIDAHRTRRPVQLLVSGGQSPVRGADSFGKADQAAVGRQGGYIQATRWKLVPTADLDYIYAFIERLGQRYESYTANAATALWNVKVLYTTAPGQTPQGDISDNGTFVPQTASSWVPDNSPLLARLETALRDGLQVKLGLEGSEIHEVEIVSHLGSAARPIWILEDFRLSCDDEAANQCTNVPTVQNPTSTSFNNIPRPAKWRGSGYFNEGVWRFVVDGVKSCLLIDDCQLCPNQTDQTSYQEHAYLKGLHKVELKIKDYVCSSTFQVRIYRIP